MKNKKYILIVSVGIIVAGISYLNLFGTDATPYDKMIREPEHQATDTEPDKGKSKSPVPVKEESIQLNDNLKNHDVTEIYSSEEKSERPPVEKTDKAGAENDKTIVDRELLRKIFPDKIALIPITPEEVEARKQTILETNKKFRQILTNTATEEEINSFYDDKSNLLKDRMEILQFAISAFGDTLSEDGLRRQQTTLATLEAQLDKTPIRRAKAVARLKKLTANNEEG